MATNLKATHQIGAYRVSLVRDGADLVAEGDGAIVRTPADAARLARQLLPEDDQRESFICLLVNIRHRVIATSVISVGCLTSSLVHPREAFRPAIVACAAAVVFAHNHPTGDPEPSAEDLALTRLLASAGTLMGIEVLDHVIVGQGARYVSLKERGAV